MAKMTAAMPAREMMPVNQQITPDAKSGPVIFRNKPSKSGLLMGRIDRRAARLAFYRRQALAHSLVVEGMWNPEAVLPV